MSEMTSSAKVNPIKITVSGEVYELDFSRESIKFAEARQFNPDEVLLYPVTKIPEFFYYAFRKNHKNVARSQTDAILEKMGGITPAFIERLSQLYTQAALSHLIVTEEDGAKNAEVTVEM